MALRVIGYGIIQASMLRLTRRSHHGGGTARRRAFILAPFPASIAMAVQQEWPAGQVLVVGLILFGSVFAINRVVHSYFILAYSDHDKVCMNAGFYHMTNASGRLAGTVLSGLVYQHFGPVGSLCLSNIFVIAAGFLSFGHPEINGEAGAESASV